MAKQNGFLSDEEIVKLEKQLVSTFVSALSLVCVLLACAVFLAACGAPAETDENAAQQSAFLQSCADQAECPEGMACSIGSAAMPGRCTRDCAINADCSTLLPESSQGGIGCDQDELLCVARCGRNVACPDELPACFLGTCVASCHDQLSDVCWVNGQAE
jgi:hypothetical protein